MNRHVRKRRRAVAAYAGTSQAMQTEIHIVGNGEARVGKYTAARLRVIHCTRSRGSRVRLTGVVAVTEEARNTPDLVVAHLRVKSSLYDYVRRNVAGVVRRKVIQTAARTGIADEEVVVRIARGVDDLRIFQRCCHGCDTELLLQAESTLTSPAKTYVVLVIDDERRILSASVGSLFRLRHQRPHLAPRNRESVRHSGLTPELALTKRVAVALVVVARDARALEVGFKVAF